MRAFSIFEAKSVQEGSRVIKGIASTPRPDRVGDIVDPDGMIKNGPIKLFLYHNHNLPVGSVEFGTPSKKGIPFEAAIPDVAEEGEVKKRVEEAWHSIKYRLLQAVSIGFKALNDGWELTKEGGIYFKKWEILELSLVGVPANPDALI